MLFQTIERNKNCYGFYANGQINIDLLPDRPSQTWDYTHLCDENTELAKIYCGGKTFLDVCPENLKEDAVESFDKLKAFMRSMMHAKVDLEENCFYDLLPEKFILEHFELRNKVTDHVLQTHDKPANYEHLRNASELIFNIQQNKLKIDLETVKNKLPNPKAQRFLKSNYPNKINYNLFGAVTGRLTLDKTSFPILNLDKDMRDCLKPNNHRFVELDYNSAELRVLLALSGEKQPNIDLHEWNAKHIYGGKLDRAKAKQKIFSWLYDTKNDVLAEKIYDKELIIKNYWNGNEVETVYKRKIQCDKDHAVNYVIQSTASDLVLEQAYKIHKLLSGKKSYVAFYLYDSIVLDFHFDDLALLKQVADTFADTRFGNFLTNVSVGRNYGEMRKQ
jgi:mRNA-degrading endonuclease YafQ of YafQ-DinJ toxin-antitoxin module